MRLPEFAALCVLLATSHTAFAGPYTDDLSKCLVASTSQSDRVALARWIFISFSAHPGVAPISAVKPADVDAANAQAGQLFMKLLTESCRDKAKVAIRYEGTVAIQLSFQTLGQVAGVELASDPRVQARMSGMLKSLDENKIKSLAAESDPKEAK
jgi:hypothetical protein